MPYLPLQPFLELRELPRGETLISIGDGATEPTINHPLPGVSVHRTKRKVSYKELCEGIPERQYKAEAVYTVSQMAALEELTDLADTYFSGLGTDLAFRPRFNALVIAATGCGKTKIARDLAERIGAVFATVSLGEWIVRGAAHEPSTITSIKRILKANRRTVLLLDEVDKFTSQTDSAWVRYVAAEVWALLDRRLALGDQPPSAIGEDEELDELRDRLENGLFIVGAGTFQQAWEMSERQTVGFNGSACPEPDDGAIIAAIDKHGGVSPELLSRFSPKPLLIQYPSRSEIPELLVKLGLVQLAKEVGVTIDPNSVSFKKCGMRTFEQIGARLLIEKMRQMKRGNKKKFEEKIVRGSRDVSA
jgi:hypothetical protein